MQGALRRFTSLLLLVLCTACTEKAQDDITTNERGLIQLTIPADVDLPLNAYAFLLDKKSRARTLDYVSNRLLQHKATRSSGDLTLQIRLADGSTALIQRDADNPTFTILPGSVKDQSGNYVGDDADRMTGGAGQTTFHDFSAHPADRDRFVEWMQSLGAEFAGQEQADHYTCRSRVIDEKQHVTCAGKYQGN